MKKIRLRKKVIPVLLSIAFIIPVIAFIFLANKGLKVSTDYNEYVSDEIVNESIPVINSTKKIINPYTDQSVKVVKDYYDYKAEEEKQLNSILVHDNTYIQNTGIDYASENTFDVISVLEGTVENVKEDEMTGKMVEVKNDDGYTVIYQSLSEIEVKKGDIVSQGQTIGKSGINELDKSIGNHLHFEVYKNGQSINPQAYINMDVKIEKEN